MNTIQLKDDKKPRWNNLEDLVSYIFKIAPILQKIETYISDNLSPHSNKTFVGNEYKTDIGNSSIEIMKIVDGLSQNISIIFSQFTEIFDTSIKEKQKLAEFLQELYNASQNNGLSKYSNFLYENLQKTNQMIEEDYQQVSKFSDLQNLYEEICDEFTSLYMALEIQDLTAKQLNTVSFTLNEIKERITFLSSSIESIGKENLLNSIKPNLIDLNRKIASNNLQKQRII